MKRNVTVLIASSLFLLLASGCGDDTLAKNGITSSPLTVTVQQGSGPDLQSLDQNTNSQSDSAGDTSNSSGNSSGSNGDTSGSSGGSSGSNNGGGGSNPNPSPSASPTASPTASPGPGDQGHHGDDGDDEDHGGGSGGGHHDDGDDSDDGDADDHGDDGDDADDDGDHHGGGDEHGGSCNKGEHEKARIECAKKLRLNVARVRVAQGTGTQSFPASVNALVFIVTGKAKFKFTLAGPSMNLCIVGRGGGQGEFDVAQGGKISRLVADVSGHSKIKVNSAVEKLIKRVRGKGILQILDQVYKGRGGKK